MRASPGLRTCLRKPPFQPACLARQQGMRTKNFRVDSSARRVESYRLVVAKSRTFFQPKYLFAASEACSVLQGQSISVYVIHTTHMIRLRHRRTRCKLTVLKHERPREMTSGRRQPGPRREGESWPVMRWRMADGRRGGGCKDNDSRVRYPPT